MKYKPRFIAGTWYATKFDGAKPVSFIACAGYKSVTVCCDTENKIIETAREAARIAKNNIED